MWNRIKDSLPLNIILLAVALWVGYSALNLVVEAISLRKEAKDREEKIIELNQKKAELEAYIAELQSREAIEREAKERLNLKLPGEEVVIVVPEKDSPEEAPKNIWDKIKSFFR